MLALSAAVGISTLIASIWNIYVASQDLIQARASASPRYFRLEIHMIFDSFAKLIMTIAITGVMFLRLSDNIQPSGNSFYIYGCLLLVQSLLFFVAFLRVYENLYERQSHSM